MRLPLALGLLLLAVPTAAAQAPMPASLTVENIVLDTQGALERGEPVGFSFTVARSCGNQAQVLDPASVRFAYQAPPTLLVTGADVATFTQQTCATMPSQFVTLAGQLTYVPPANDTGLPPVLRLDARSEYQGGSILGRPNDVEFSLAVPVNATAPTVKAIEPASEQAAPGGFVVAPALALAALALRRRL